MSRESMRALLDARGSFPDEADVRANFATLFELADRAREEPEDLAGAFAQALDQWSHVDAVVDPAIAERLRRWAIARWPAGTDVSPETCTALGRLLLNVPTPETRAFLAERRAEATDHDLRRALEALLAQHPADDD